MVKFLLNPCYIACKITVRYGICMKHILARYGTLRAGIVGGENLFETTGYLEFEEGSG